MTAATTTAPELLPCPFCGGEARYQLAGGIICNNCGAGIPCRGDDFRPWNRRAPVAQDAEPVAWQLKDTEQGVINYTGRRDRAEHRMTIPGFVVTPLYAHPAPQPSDEAATLRDGDLTDRLQKLGRDMDRHAHPDWDESEDIFAAVNTIITLRAQLAEAEGELARFRAERSYVVGANDGYEAATGHAEAEMVQLRAALKAAEDHADVLVRAGQLLSDMIEVNIGDLPNTQAVWEEALAAHQARRAGE